MNEKYPENPNCAETHVTFRIVADDLEPNEISIALRMLPSASARKGGPSALLKSRKAPVSRVGLWMLMSEGNVDSTNLEAHLDFILDQLDSAKDQIKQMAKDQEKRVEFHCYWMSETGQGGPVLSVEVLKRIVALGADLDFDIYFAGE